MPRMLFAVSCLLLAVSFSTAADADYALKTAAVEPPKELKEPVRQLLGDQALQVSNAKGDVYCEVWFCKELSAKATPDQVKNGLTYREAEESTILGAIRFPQGGSDYRKQKIKPGVYTLRLGFQPNDGDHMGTAPYKEFCLVCPADADGKTAPLETKALQELSAKSVMGSSSHPAVFLLFPNEKPAAQPKITSPSAGHWLVGVKEPVKAGDQKTSLGINLVVVGASDS